MRTLSITRRKALAGCLGKYKVYIEEPRWGDTVINGIRCRKLGVLKNGETAVFQIENHAQMLFVIADKLSKGYSNDFCRLPEGEEDISLIGKASFNPFTGNAFRFDDVTDYAVLENRRRGARRGATVFIVAFVAAVVLGALIGGVGTVLHNIKMAGRDITVDDLTITLPYDFVYSKQNSTDYAVAFANDDYIVYFAEEPYSLMTDIEGSTAMHMTVLDYTVYRWNYLVREYDDYKNFSGVLPDSGFAYAEFETDNEDSNARSYHLAVTYKTDFGFWHAEFIAPESKREEAREAFLEWARTVRFE